ncbi:MAG: FAD-dependent oxidoreductase, partial [Planctomycetes bacterium]|nr:FAD-dependent oxidoreductase [Planctomycetota bacterium]
TLYSRNIKNLFCAGRCHSATHSAMSATRVMGTTSIMGQVVGTAAAIAVANELSPRGVYEKKISDLKQQLMEDDCYLPWNARSVPELSLNAEISSTEGEAENLRNGIDRPIGEEDNGWQGKTGAAITYTFKSQAAVKSARIVFDSDLNRIDTATNHNAKNMRYRYDLGATKWCVPATMVKSFRIEAQKSDGTWDIVSKVENNYQRLVTVDLNIEAKAIRLIPESTWGAEQCHIFAFDVR